MAASVTREQKIAGALHLVRTNRSLPGMLIAETISRTGTDSLG